MFGFILKAGATLLGVVTGGGGLWDWLRNRGKGADALQKHTNNIMDGKDTIGGFFDRAVKSTKGLLKDEGGLEERLSRAVRYEGPAVISGTFQEEAQKMANLRIAAKEAAGEEVTEAEKKVFFEQAIETLSGKDDFAGAAAKAGSEDSNPDFFSAENFKTMGWTAMIAGIIALLWTGNMKHGAAIGTAAAGIAAAVNTTMVGDMITEQKNNLVAMFTGSAEGKDSIPEQVIAFSGLKYDELELGEPT